MADVQDARDSAFLVDSRRHTLIVVGDKGRAHVFNRQGKLVTSVRYSPAAIEKKCHLGLWRPAAPEEVEQLRKQLSDISAADLQTEADSSRSKE